MNEHEWLVSTDFAALLRFAALKASNRKLRLFGCACCREALRRVDEPDLYEQAVYYSELLADEVTATAYVSADRVEQVCERIRNRHLPKGGPMRLDETGPWFAALAMLADFACLDQTAFDSRLLTVSDYTRIDRTRLLPPAPKEDRRIRQARFLRDLVGNPFRPVTVRPEWLIWLDRQIPRLARHLYDERRFDDLPILADALEDAGCADEQILTHLRGGGPHVKGCWAVDLLIGMW